MSSERRMRLGPLALRLLARRRRWLRWAAVALACLAVASALLGPHRRPAPRTVAVPIVLVTRAIAPGQVINEADVETVWREAPPGPAGPALHPGETSGRVAIRPLRPGDAVTSGNAVPLLAYYGVAARIPPGMRAVAVAVPAMMTFGGELAPQSRVDLLGAFDAGAERAAVTVLTSGIVLRIIPPSDRPSASDRGSVSDPARGLGGPVVVVLAIPRDREREMALAQAFGRIVLAVHPAGAAADPAGTAARADPATYPETRAAILRQYLGLPPGSDAMGPGPLSRGVPWGMAPWIMPPVAGSSRPGRVRAVPPIPASQAASASEGLSAPAGWAVEVITGEERRREVVPAGDAPAGGRPAPDDAQVLPGMSQSASGAVR